MASVVNTNVMSINAQQNLMKTQNSMATTIERLSSGLRINSAKDDAAGLAVSEGMTAQVRGLEVGKRNANDAISLAQTAEGALSSMTDNVQRLRELAVQAASDTLTDDDRALLQKEADQLVANMDDISANTSFNGQKLLDASGGTGGVFKIQVGANAADTIDLDLSGMDMTALPAVGGFDISSQAAAVTSIGAADTDLNTLNGHRADLGAMQNRFDSVIANASNYSENLQAARSRIQDTDFAAETANLTKNQILSQAGTAMLAQANSAPQSVLSLL